MAELNDALVCAEFGSSRDDTIIEKKLNSMKAVIKKAHGYKFFMLILNHLKPCLLIVSWLNLV